MFNKILNRFLFKKPSTVTLVMVRYKTQNFSRMQPLQMQSEVCEPDTTEYSSRAPHELRFRYRRVKRDLSSGGQQRRIDKLRRLVTGIIRYERVEGSYVQTSEARYYVERLIQEAVVNGDLHKKTMHMADYWLLQKDLVHKLFKVLVPRFQDYTSAYTRMYNLPPSYPGMVYPMALLELKGNPYPPVVPSPTDNSKLLTNILIDALKAHYRRKRGEHKQQVDYGDTSMLTGDDGSEMREMQEIDTSIVGLSPQIINDVERIKIKQLNRGKLADRTLLHVKDEAYRGLKS